MNNDKILKRALNFYGVDLQVIVAMEELAELISELSRYFLRESRNDGLSSKEKELRIAGEIADVEIVCKTLRILIGDGVVNEKIKEKMARLNERISKGKST